MSSEMRRRCDRLSSGSVRAPAPARASPSSSAPLRVAGDGLVVGAGSRVLAAARAAPLPTRGCAACILGRVCASASRRGATREGVGGGVALRTRARPSGRPRRAAARFTRAPRRADARGRRNQSPR
eukprot:scaffold5103_cov350-Prasinococcus_capsulatus_cf.AAC.7